MATWFGRNFWKSPRHGRPPGLRVRKRSGRLMLRTEALEDRLLPPLSPMILLDINPPFSSSNPKFFTQVCPKSDESGAEMSVVVVEAWLTTWGEAESLPVEIWKLASPL
jgi:hypothetical protein